ncbi:hypothetical protein, partial [Endozoicomonas sp. SESOKO3]
ALLGNPSYSTDTNDYVAPISPPDNKSHRLVSYRLKTSFIESISWQLLYATHFPVAYELVMTSNDAALSGKPYSWIPVEAFVAVGWLLKSYWHPDSLLFKPLEPLKSSQDYPFTITTAMIGSGNMKQNQPSGSSVQQVPQATSNRIGSYTGSLYSGSGGSNEDSEQHQHTLGLNCFVHLCNGVCRFRHLSNRESAEWPLNSAGNSTGHTLHDACPPELQYEQHHDQDDFITTYLDTLIDPPIDHVSDFGTIDPSIYLPDGFGTIDTSIYFPDGFNAFNDPPAEPLNDFPDTQGIGINSTNSRKTLNSMGAAAALTRDETSEESCER